MVSGMKQQLLISGEFTRLREKCRLLRTELAKVIVDRDELLNTVKPNLEARYYSVVGKEQHRLFLVRHEVLRIRRRIELVRAAYNRGEEPDYDQIEKRLDEDLRRWVEEMDELARKIKWAEHRSQMPALSIAEARELKKTYHELVRRLHPDINRELPDNFRYLWERVLTAYRDGDLEELRTLRLLLREEERAPEEPSVLEQLAADAENLKKKIKKELIELAEIKKRFPFNFYDKLDDKEWIAAQKKTIRKQLAEMKRHRQAYSAILAELGGSKKYTVH